MKGHVMIRSAQSSDRYAAVKHGWRRHLAAEFPGHLRGAELDGVDMVLLDCCTAGCVSTWLSNGGKLDEERRRIMVQLLEKLDRVIPMIDDPAGAAYYSHLRDLARSIQ